MEIVCCEIIKTINNKGIHMISKIFPVILRNMVVINKRLLLTDKDRK